MTKRASPQNLDLHANWNSGVFVVAEISANHNGSLARAQELVEAAAEAGVDGIKLQTYLPNTITIKDSSPQFLISSDTSPWKGRSLYELYQEGHTPWDWHASLFELAANKGLVSFSTPFDTTAVDFLESLEVPMYKISSFENCDYELIEKVVTTGKPLIVSTGASTLIEIYELVEFVRELDCVDLTLLKCTSSYPAPITECNLVTMQDMAQRFSCRVGYSDHTLGIDSSITAAALGANVIEKHITLDRSEGGVDSRFSLEPHEMNQLVTGVRAAWAARGQISYGVSPSELGSLHFKRSLFVVQDVKTGEEFTHMNVKSIRPGSGLAPSFLRTVIGKRATSDIARGTPLRETHFSK